MSKSKPTDETEAETAPVEAGPDLVTERFTSGGEGPEGQPDTVVEDPASAASDPSESTAEAETEG